MINILNNAKIKLGLAIKIKKEKGKLTIKNNSSKVKYIVYLNPKRFIFEYLHVLFKGKLISGVAPELLIVNAKKQLRGKCMFNMEMFFPKNTALAFLILKIQPKSEFELDELSYEFTHISDIVNPEHFRGDYLVITPMYPSNENLYSASFVYSKVKEYVKQGLKVDVAITTGDPDAALFSYEFDKKIITKMNYNDLRTVIQRNNYKKILVHFIDSQMANALNACNLENTELFIYCHGADVDLFNANIISKYFDHDRILNDEEIKYRLKRQNVLKQYDKMPNVKWIFNTEWNYQNAKKANDLEFKNHEIIPCIIDQDVFKYKQRDKEKRKKILVLKRMDDIRQYAVDIAVRTILELSKRPFFDDLEFLVAGNGDLFDQLVSPIRKFSNVKIEQKFYSHKDMNELYHEYGILLVPSRYDTQGVIAGEAAMTGMVLVASKNTGMSSMLSENIGTFFDTEYYEQAADIIEHLYNDPEYFIKKSAEFRKCIEKTASKGLITKEIKLLKQNFDGIKPKLYIHNISEKPILTVVVASYNVEQYLRKSIYSLIINNKNVDDLEIIIVNDGSKDKTSEIAKELVKLTTIGNKSIVKLIDKENGGHGSAVNAGLKAAKGKFFKLMDGDDVLNTVALEKHIETLKTTDADLILTNLVFDYAVPSIYTPEYKYKFMIPYKKYKFDDLCYETYGFPGYGPVLSTTTINTEKLRKAGCKLSEKAFYVDVQYNYYVTAASDTVIYEPLDIYYYYLGRTGQSISKTSYMKNYMQHRHVLVSLLDLINNPDFSKMKRDHMSRVQVSEMIRHQYTICLNYFESKKMFKEVDKLIKNYPEFYSDQSYQTPLIRTLRKTKGWFFRILLTISKLKNRR